MARRFLAALAFASASATLTAPQAAPAQSATDAARPAQNDAAPLAPAVSVTPAEKREIVARAIVTGTLVPREEILVAAEVEGLRITDVLVEEGAVVEKGQVLIRLSDDLVTTQLAQNTAQIARADAGIAQARSTILQAEASATEAQQALDRAQALQRSGNVTQAVLEQRIAAARQAEGVLAAARSALEIAEAEKRTAQAQRREIEVRLDRTQIKAPAAGLVSRKNARVGATASAAAEPLLRIIRDGEIELEGEVTETQLPLIREGAVAQIPAEGGGTITGRVRLVLPEVDRATRLGRVRISLGRNEALRIGSFARGTVEIARSEGVTVPLSSVLYGPKGPVVQVVKDGRVQSRRVKTGLSADGAVEIAEGVAAGESVVLRAGSFLRDGDPVRAIAAETAQNGTRGQ